MADPLTELERRAVCRHCGEPVKVDPDHRHPIYGGDWWTHDRPGYSLCCTDAAGHVHDAEPLVREEPNE